RFAVFTGGWTLAAAEAVAAGDEEWRGELQSPAEPGLDLLTELVDKSLVLVEERNGEARYRLLETLRQYGLEHLAANGEADTMRRRHAQCYLALAEEALPHLHGPCQALWRYWDMHGDTTEGQDRLAALRVRAGSRGQAAASVLHGLGTLGHKQGNLDDARRFQEEALAIYRELDDCAGAAEVLSSLALVLHDQGAADCAHVLANESLTIMRALGDDWGVSTALGNLALIVKNMGDIAASVPLEEESLALRRRIGDLRGLSFVLNNLGVTAQRLGDLATARARHEESLAIKRQIEDAEGVGYSLRNLGEVALLQGDLVAAAVWYDEALHLAWRVGNRLVAASCVHGLGAIAGARGALDAAARLLSAAEAWRDSFGLRLSEQRRADDDQRIEAVHAALGDEAFAPLWAEGRSMPLNDAIGHAHAVAASSVATAQPAATKLGDDVLSTREREVARLVAQGITNRQIADELVIARSTVDRHVVHILRKLDLASRAQIAVWTVEHRLETPSG
ncbi:MAG: tetratricopeptide repeat protein, partial [Dehalococcoidia bacterium]